MNIFKSKERKRQEKLLDKFINDHTYNPKVNIFPKPCDAQEALNFLEELILGPDWYIVDPLPNIQANTIVAAAIAEKYIKK